MVLILIVASCTLLGWLILVALRQQPGGWLETAVLCCTLGVAIIGWAGVLLAELSWFSLGSMVVMWLLLLIGLAVVGWQRRQAEWVAFPSLPYHQPWFTFVPSWLEYGVLGVWLLTAVWLFFRPHEFLIGAADAGVYANLGASIAREGSIVIADPFLAELDPTLYPAFLRPQPTDPIAPYYLLPAFYVLGQPLGQITPQFYPGHPVWLAIAYSLSGGQPLTMLLLPGLWALLASLVLYLLGRQLGGWQTAVLVLAGFTINALQLWFARYPTAESLSQYLLLAGLWSLGQWLHADQPRPIWGLAAGLALGQLFMVRIDTVVMLPIFVGLAAWQYAGSKRPGWQLAWFWLPFMLSLLHALAHGLWQSQPYFWSVFGVVGRVTARNGELLLLGGAVATGGAWYIRRRFGTMLPPRWQQWLWGAAAVALLLWAVYGWFVRPYVNTTVLWDDPYSGTPIPLLNHENWLRLGWYLTAVGLWLGILGACGLLWQSNRQTAVWLTTSLLFALVYLTNTRANPHQIYVMRRYVPAVVPLLTSGAAYLLYLVACWKRPFSPWLALLLAMVWLFGQGWAARGFVSQVDYAGVSDQLTALNNEFAPHSVILFNDQAAVGPADQVGTPLRFLYHHDVLILRDPAAITDAQLLGLLRGWQENGRSVYWLGDPAWLNAQAIEYATSSAEISSQRLESSYETKPRQIVPFTLRFEIAHLR